MEKLWSDWEVDKKTEGRRPTDERSLNIDNKMEV